jgi:hypothetical protein
MNHWKCTGTCFIQKIYAPSSSLLQGKHLPFTPSPLRLNIFRLFVSVASTCLHTDNYVVVRCFLNIKFSLVAVETSIFVVATSLYI